MTKFIHTDHVIFCLDLGLLPRSIICNTVVFRQPPGHGYLDVPPSSGNASPKLARLLLLKAIFPCPFLLVSLWLEILESALTFPFLISYTQCVTRPFLSIISSFQMLLIVTTFSLLLHTYHCWEMLDYLTS